MPMVEVCNFDPISFLFSTGFLVKLLTSLSNQLTFLKSKNHGVTGSYPVIRVLSPRNFPLRGDLSVNYFWSLDELVKISNTFVEACAQGIKNQNTFLHFYSKYFLPFRLAMPSHLATPRYVHLVQSSCIKFYENIHASEKIISYDYRLACL